jgi:hypothetical protein
MKTCRSWLVAAGLAVASLGAAACSDDNNGSTTPDARPGIDAGTTPDGATSPDGGAAATFASEVIDLIENQTADTTPPVAVDFASADTEDPAAYSTLF